LSIDRVGINTKLLRVNCHSGNMPAISNLSTPKTTTGSDGLKAVVSDPRRF
jgi:hypothetical protein